mgnify:CR=1 FL=1
MEVKFIERRFLAANSDGAPDRAPQVAETAEATDQRLPLALQDVIRVHGPTGSIEITHGLGPTPAVGHVTRHGDRLVGACRRLDQRLRRRLTLV